uniref:ATP-grasp domain-containing protein n=1 Tax=viral metagenome TaxID=1070528 RepID=A0A6M3LEC8_9ZZZZ
MRILITGAGGGGADPLVAEWRECHWDDMDGHTFVGVNSDPYILASSDIHPGYVVPDARKVTPMQYRHALANIAVEEDIDLIIPNTYGEVDAMSGADLIGTDNYPGPFPLYMPYVGDIRRCQDKWLFWRWLKSEGLGWTLPATFPVDALAALPKVVDNLTWGLDLPPEAPLWLRARRGAGAYAATQVVGASEALWWIKYHQRHKGMKPSDFIISEYLPGRDIIVSMLWRKGRLLWLRSFEKCGYFEGASRPSGTSSTGIVDKAFYDESHFELCRYIVSTLNPHAHGNWTLDWKQDAEGDWKLTECNIGRFIQGTLLFNRIPEQRDWLDAYLKAYSGWDFMDEPVWYDNTGWFTVRSVNRGLYLGKEEGLADLKRIAETN